MTTAIDQPMVVEEPGVYDIPDHAYHADPVPGGSLSSSGARKLLPPSCPAKFRYWADHGSEHKAEFDFGHAAHKLVLGVGPEIVIVEADNWLTKAAKQERAEAYTADKVPVLRHEYDHVTAMAASLRRHPLASALMDPSRGAPERSLFWIDHATDVWLRARLDWLPDPHAGRLMVSDYKTTDSAAPDAIQRAVYRYGYHQQADFYLTGTKALGLAADAAFLFVFQEKTPPYIVTVVELDATALRIGHELNRQAIETYAKCRAENHWPAYTDDVELVSLPAYVERQYSGGAW